jgi:hypothetical protein
MPNSKFIFNIIEKEIDKKYFILDKALNGLSKNTFVTINMKARTQRSYNDLLTKDTVIKSYG